MWFLSTVIEVSPGRRRGVWRWQLGEQRSRQPPSLLHCSQPCKIRELHEKTHSTHSLYCWRTRNPANASGMHRTLSVQEQFFLLKRDDFCCQKRCKSPDASNAPTSILGTLAACLGVGCSPERTGRAAATPACTLKKFSTARAVLKENFNNSS